MHRGETVARGNGHALCGLQACTGAAVQHLQAWRVGVAPQPQYTGTQASCPYATSRPGALAARVVRPDTAAPPTRLDRRAGPPVDLLSSSSSLP